MSTPPETLSAQLTPVALSEDAFQFTVPSGYGQGKATFGGLVVGAVVRAMAVRMQSEPGLKLRSLSSQLVGAPQPGPSEIKVTILRKTRTVTTISADFFQHEELMSHTTALFAAARAPDMTLPPVSAPKIPDWKQIEPLDMSLSFAPEFSSNFVYRFIEGIPFSGSEPLTSGFIWPRNPGPQRDDSMLAAITDAWWLATFVAMAAPRPAVTLSFGLEIHGGLAALPEGEPIYNKVYGTGFTEGYASETRELWTPDGQLIALNHQTIAVVK